MIDLEIPGYGRLALENLLLDYNGTLALDGHLLPEVRERLTALSKLLEIRVVTADTFGTVTQELEGTGVETVILQSADHTGEKRQVLSKLGAQKTVAIGNGNNDREMLEHAALGIAVIGGEGCATATLLAAQIAVPSIAAALDLLLEPGRLTATLRR